MNKLMLRNFLNKAVIDPNQKKDRLLKMIIDEGTVTQYEFKVFELIEEAKRIRGRMDSGTRATKETLLEFYLEKITLANTYLALAAVKTELAFRPVQIIKNVPPVLDNIDAPHN